MGLKSKKTLVCATVLICLWNLDTTIKASQPEAQTSPYLSFKFRGVSDQKGKSANDAITLKRTEHWVGPVQDIDSAELSTGSPIRRQVKRDRRTGVRQTFLTFSTARRPLSVSPGYESRQEFDIFPDPDVIVQDAG